KVSSVQQGFHGGWVWVMAGHEQPVPCAPVTPVESVQLVNGAPTEHTEHTETQKLSRREETENQTTTTTTTSVGGGQADREYYFGQELADLVLGDSLPLSS